ncbi:hypothetical protein FBQ95_10975 [Chloroflexi bacterium CFX3]|nr:hypothetical protein [Chloroflexi bacterium CFX3]
MRFWYPRFDTAYAPLLLVDKSRLWDEDHLGVIRRGIPNRLSTEWQAPKVRFMRDDEIVREVESPEFPYSFLRSSNFSELSDILICDAVAREALEPLVGQAVEFLPLDCPNEPQRSLWLLNVLTVAECLDYERSEFTYWDSGAVKAVRRYVFRTGCLEGQHIFRLPLFNYVEIYVSDEFKRLIEQQGLTGLRFELAQWETQTE